MDAISRLLKPRSVAVIGASADPGKTSGRPVSYLVKHAYAGDIYPVNPKVSRIGELACYPDVASLPAVPDVGIVLLGAERAHLAVRDLAARGTAAAIVLASGYAETGEEGARRQRQLIEAAGSMRLLGPNTIGLVNLTDNIVLSATGALEMDTFPVGPVGVVSQSGGILGALLSRAAARGIGLSKLISTSNEVDLELADFIDLLADDDATRVIALYVEAVRDPQKFRAAALKAARAGKPVVAFKIGRSEAGARAAVSHTGALAGADRMYDALFRQVGVIRAQTFGELLDISAALASGRVLRGNRVAILTSTGGAGTLVSDSLGMSGFETPAPDADTAAQLRALQTGDHAALDRNPIDVTLAGLQPDLLRSAIKVLLASPSYDALTIIVGSSGIGNPELMANAIRDCLPLSDKPVIAYVSPHAPEAAALLTQRGVPAYANAEGCTAGLAGMLHASRWKDTGEAAVHAINMDLGELPAGSLDEAQAKQLFARFGVPCVRETAVSTAAEAAEAARAFGGRVVLKVLSGEITHKSDVGGVAVGVAADEIGARLDAMAVEVEAKAGLKPTRFLVQEMVSGGTELILGMHRDPLGTAILLGMGGITAELLKDTAMRLLPPEGGLSRGEALSLVRELKTWPLLDGFRGRPKADVDALVSAIVAFSQMAAQLGDRLVEAEINPVFVLPQGQGVRAADGVAVLGGAVADADQTQAAAFIDALDRQGRRHEVSFEGRRVVWRRFGDGPPLVLLHGGHGRWLHWARNIEALSQRHAVWVPDLPGYGDSDEPPQPTMDSLVAATLATLDELVGASTPIDVAGFSFGGLAAAHLAAHRPAVRHLALVGPGGHGGPRRPRGELLSWREAARTHDAKALAKVMRHNLLMHMLDRDDSIDALALQIHTEACQRTRFRSKPISRAGGLADVLRPYRGPLLLLFGERDVTVDPAVAGPTLSEGHASARTHVFAGAGHWAQYEASDELNGVLLDWLDDKPTGATP
jgi:acyl-CoA synthetase (NDP forming)/pimeloyl-ACP methyl ester carboxylesterase